MIIALDNKTHPEVELLLLDLEYNPVTFKNIDGACTAPLLKYETDLPTVEDYKASIEAVLGETEKLEV
uniref:Uncharacterized protein n=1 Tax=viral metagenome TaxID=1070528 RepID=A0A6M3JKM7_9ZZZZ